MDDIKTFLQKGNVTEALVKFRDLSEKEQEDFFRNLAPTLFPPPLIAVLHRKLRPDSTFDDFYKAWLPPLKEGQDLEHYEPFPAYVMNAVNKDDSSDIITIGYAWKDLESFESYFPAQATTENQRHENIEKVAHKTEPSRIYIVKSVTKLGS